MFSDDEKTKNILRHLVSEHEKYERQRGRVWTAISEILRLKEAVKPIKCGKYTIMPSGPNSFGVYCFYIERSNNYK